MTPEEHADWYEGSVCAGCGSEACWGECPEYPEAERKALEEEARGICAPVIPCRVDPEFRQYLKRASEEVASWPEWKQGVLGGVAKSSEDTTAS